MKLTIVRNDPWLEPYALWVAARHERALQKERELIGTHANLQECALRHLWFGMHKRDDAWVFREWAPNAETIYLIGEFTGWREQEDFLLQKRGDGVWEISLPITALHHGDLYRLSVHWRGGQGDRIPAWANRVVQDDTTKIFNAQVWAPDEPYEWRNEWIDTTGRPPLIYEAHAGMASEEGRIATFNEFRRHVLPRIVEGGYNTIQLMAVQEHPYYGSFGYHVSSFFAPSSRFGTPEDLKALIDAAHDRGVAVIMDLVHSHAVKNEVEGLACFDGNPSQYFHEGARRLHSAWDSLCFNYAKHEVLHFLLSNCRYWLEEFRFDGFRFDGVTSMLYLDHGLARNFTEYSMYFDGRQDEDAITYLMLANRVIKQVNPQSLSIAEEMSGMPGVAAPFEDGGFGFDCRLAMGVPDYWIKVIKERPDEFWDVGELYYELTRKRNDELTINYAESHDQALVGDQSISFRLMGPEMYDRMNLASTSLIIDRGMALHKMIRLVTIATAGGGYLNFMGNEFGHPEWIDFPREGNNWSYHYARRQWRLADHPDLRYKFLGAFDREMLRIFGSNEILKEAKPRLVAARQSDQVLVFNRGPLVCAFNFNPSVSFTDYGFAVEPGTYRIVLNTDAGKFGGQDLVDSTMTFYSLPDPGTAPLHMLKVYLPARSVLVFELDV